MLKSQRPLPLPTAIADTKEPVPIGELFTYKEVAAALKLTPQTVMDWVKRGMVCSPLYFGANARFTRQMLDTMLAGPSIPGMHAVAESPRALTMKKAHDKKRRIKAIWSKPKKTGKPRTSTQRTSSPRTSSPRTSTKSTPRNTKRKGGKS